MQLGTATCSCIEKLHHFEIWRCFVHGVYVPWRSQRCIRAFLCCYQASHQAVMIKYRACVMRGSRVSIVRYLLQTCTAEPELCYTGVVPSRFIHIQPGYQFALCDGCFVPSCSKLPESVTKSNGNADIFPMCWSDGDIIN